MNKRSLLLPLLTLIAFFCACNPNARWEVEDVHISIDLQYISAGFIECSFSTDKEAYYLIAIDSVRQGYDPMERQKQFMMLALDSAQLTYLRWRNELLQAGEFHIAPFASHSLQYGAVNHFFTSLTPNTDYWVYAFVVDPNTMKPMGKLHIVSTKTHAQSQVDITFHYRIKGHWDYIYPLDDHRNIHNHFPYIATTRDSAEIAQSGMNAEDYFSQWMQEQFNAPNKARIYYGIKAIENDGIGSHTTFQHGTTYYTAIGGFDGSIKQKLIYKFTWMGDSTDIYLTEMDAINRIH